MYADYISILNIGQDIKELQKTAENVGLVCNILKQIIYL
jgi:hypothetical protein